MKNHGLNIFILFVWMMLTCGGLGNAACKYDGIYWVPFVVNAGIFILTGIREWRKYDDARKAKRKEGE